MFLLIKTFKVFKTACSRISSKITHLYIVIKFIPTAFSSQYIFTENLESQGNKVYIDKSFSFLHIIYKYVSIRQQYQYKRIRLKYLLKIKIQL